jgi:hypothetical protein
MNPFIRAAVHMTALASSVLAAACSPDAVVERQTQPSGLQAEIAAADPAPGGAPSQAEPIGFVVRFAADHALGRAQALEASGRCDEAARLARATIAASTELRGLCFDRFTLGGAETVLISCAPVPRAQSSAYQRDWLARFRAMRGVEYADVNMIVQVSDCAGAKLE